MAADAWAIVNAECVYGRVAMTCMGARAADAWAIVSAECVYGRVAMVLLHMHTCMGARAERQQTVPYKCSSKCTVLWDTILP